MRELLVSGELVRDLRKLGEAGIDGMCLALPENAHLHNIYLDVAKDTFHIFWNEPKNWEDEPWTPPEIEP